MTGTSMSWLRSVWSARRGICIASKAVRTATAFGKFHPVFWFLAYFAEIVPQSGVFADYTLLLDPPPLQFTTVCRAPWLEPLKEGLRVLCLFQFDYRYFLESAL